MLEQNLPVVRADRDPVISLRRMVPYMSWIEKLNLIYRIISAKYFQANPMEAQKKVLDQVPFEDLWKDTEKVQGA
jgi:pheromone shutdown protein TraB